MRPPSPSRKPRRRAENDALTAIRRGEVDAVVVAGEAGERLYLLDPLDLPYAQILDTLSHCCAVLDEHGSIVHCNHALAELLGVSPRELERTPLRARVRPTDHGGFDQLLDSERPASAAVVTIDGARGEMRVNLAVSALPSQYFPLDDNAHSPEVGGFVVVISEASEADAAGSTRPLQEQAQDLGYDLVAIHQDERMQRRSLVDRILPTITAVQLDLEWIEERLRWMEDRPHSSVFARLRAARDQLGMMAARARRSASDGGA